MAVNINPLERDSQGSHRLKQPLYEDGYKEIIPSVGYGAPAAKLPKNEAHAVQARWIDIITAESGLAFSMVIRT